MGSAYTYILECSNGAYYTGSTTDLEKRLLEHNAGEGANFTKKHLPVKLVYFEECESIKEAFLREKQIQGWSRKKKEALINNMHEKLPELSKRYTQNQITDTTLKIPVTSSASVTNQE